jgi:hypothetical protein
MEIDLNITAIDINNILTIPRLQQRQTLDEPDADLALQVLARSLTPPAPVPARATTKALAIRLPDLPDLPAHTEEFINSIHQGQILPIRVIRFPSEALKPKDYGLIFGFRRLQAKKLLVAKGLAPPSIDARVIRLTHAEYLKDEILFQLYLQALAENQLHEPLNYKDKIKVFATAREWIQILYPELKRSGKTDTSPPTPKAVSPTPVPGSSSKPQATHRPSTRGQKPGAARTAGTLTKVSERSSKQYKRVIDGLSRALMDKVTRDELSIRAADALVPLPKKQQLQLVRALEAEGITPTERAIRDHLRHKTPSAQKLTPDSPSPPTLSTAKATCDKCRTCCIADDPATCPSISNILLELERATILCLDLNHHFRWTPKLRALILPRITKLSVCATSLEADLRDPEEFAKIHPDAMTEYFVTAPRPGSRNGG